MTIAKQISAAFIAESKKKIIKFFKNPCFSCVNHYIESDDREYSSDTWSVCDKSYYFRTIEKHAQQKKFPMCEALALCFKRGFYQLGTRPNHHHFDIFDGIGYQIWGELDFIDFNAPSIGGGLSRFYRKQAKR